MENKEQIGPLNYAVIIFSIISIVSLLVDTFYVLPKEVSEVIHYFDFLVSIFFLLEFFLRLTKAKNKLHFMKWGWIDLISSIPSIGFLRYGRIFRLIRLLRIFRSFKEIFRLSNRLFEDKMKGIAYSMILLAFLLLSFSSISILLFETHPNSNIKTAEDAIWWSYCTITTVGYGDKYPVTTEGRLIGMMLMTFGVGIFSTFTAYITTTIIKSK
jgi:voltage-gated potassium channel